MSTIPNTFAEKLALSVQHSKAEIRLNADAAFAKLARIRAERNLQYAIANEFPAAFIDRAQKECNEAMYLEWGYEHYAINRDHRISCWGPGYEFDVYGTEVWASVEFDPLSFDFVAMKHNEGGSWQVGTAPTFEAAKEIASRAPSGDDEKEEEIASRAPYGDDQGVEERPAPTISKQDSDQAGDAVVTCGGQTTSVKSIVDEILKRANHGCGQHYEIFARRVASMLDDLPDQLAGADRENVEKYLEYDRY